MLQFALHRSQTGHAANAAILCVLAALSGCRGGSGDDAESSSNGVAAQTYSLGTTISGLNSSGLVLMVDASRQRVGEYLFPMAKGLDSIAMRNATAVNVPAGKTAMGLAGSLPSGTSYSVTIQTQPIGETCSIANATGMIESASVASVLVNCSGNIYAVSGTISGLNASGLVLLNNGGDALTLSANATQFKMNTGVAFGNPYAITVQAPPAGLVCVVSNGTGTVGPADVTSVSLACGSNFTLLYSFAGGSDGANPYHTLIQGSDGDFYGTTLAGGAGNVGTIFKITPGGIESVFYSFATVPYAGLVQSSDGNICGTTASGGTSGRGTVFKITPSGTETVLYSFPAGSSDPYTGLIQGSDANFYGTTGAGGAGDDGTVFKITPSGTETVLHAFAKTGSDGQTPYAGLIQGSDGNLYGTTYFGGANGFGAVFKVTPSGTETVLYSFAGGSDGEHPYAGVIQGSDGNFYGTTYQGGTSGNGTVFKVTPSGTETVLYDFAGGAGDGANPEAGVIQASDGNFYGSTLQGAAGGVGMVFKLTPNGTETILHTFAGASDGANPPANLVQGSDGNLYGSTGAGGAGGHGTFFKITLQ